MQILSPPKPRTNGKVIEESINRKVKNRLQSRFFLSLNKTVQKIQQICCKIRYTGINQECRYHELHNLVGTEEDN